MNYTIVALYHFVSLDNLSHHQHDMRQYMQSLDLCGTLLIAPEGINGTIGGSAHSVEQFVDYCKTQFGVDDGNIKYSYAIQKPFDRLKVRLKKEIITLRQPQADPSLCVGEYVQPAGWNSLVQNQDVILLDTRNLYETEIGTFQGAVTPPLSHFTDFVDYVRTELADQKDKKIAMFCTGGIRCEKASAFMLQEGFREVYHLKGGILKYLEEIPPEESLWQGECFVFDNRVSVGHGLKEGEQDETPSWERHGRRA